MAAARKLSQVAVYGEPVSPKPTKLIRYLSKKSQDDPTPNALPYSYRGAIYGSFNFPVAAEYEFHMRVGNYRPRQTGSARQKELTRRTQPDGRREKGIRGRKSKSIPAREDGDDARRPADPHRGGGREHRLSIRARRGNRASQSESGRTFLPRFVSGIRRDEEPQGQRESRRAAYAVHRLCRHRRALRTPGRRPREPQENLRMRTKNSGMRQADRGKPGHPRIPQAGHKAGNE